MRTAITFALIAAAATAQVNIPNLSGIPTGIPNPIDPGAIRIPQNTPRQLTIAFIGDSWAAGEGAPNPTGQPWDETDCHRSQQNGRFATAKALQNAAGMSLDLNAHTPPRQNVDFIDVSCSGATVAAGIVGPYEGVFRMSPNGPGQKEHPNGFAPQLDQVQQWLNGRPLDLLVISVGGNDVGFGTVVTSCMSPLVISCASDPATLDAMANGAPVYVNGQPVNGRLVGFNHLQTAFNKIRDRIQTLNLNPAKVLLVDYPNPLHFGSPVCHDFDDGTAIFSLNPNAPDAKFTAGIIGAATKNVTLAEANFLDQSLLTALNTTRNPIATQFGWDHLDFGTFANLHGFCADNAWFNTPADSMSIQGDFNGTAHPNAKGYQMFERFLTRYMAHQLNVPVTTGVRMDDEGFFVAYPAPPQPPAPGTPQAQNMNRPPIVVNQNTYDQMSPADKQYIADNGTLNVQRLVFPTPDVLTGLSVQVSTKPFEFNPTAQDMQVYNVSLHLSPEGTYTATFPLRNFDQNDDIYVRWVAAYTPFAGQTDLRHTNSSPAHFRVNGTIPAKKL